MSDTDDKILKIVTAIQDTLSKQRQDQEELWNKIKDFVGVLANFYSSGGLGGPRFIGRRQFLESF